MSDLCGAHSPQLFDAYGALDCGNRVKVTFFEFLAAIAGADFVSAHRQFSRKDRPELPIQFHIALKLLDDELPVAVEDSYRCVKLTGIPNTVNWRLPTMSAPSSLVWGFRITLSRSKQTVGDFGCDVGTKLRE
jgi:hypothetical protein